MNRPPFAPYSVTRPSKPIDLWLDRNEGATPPAYLLQILRDVSPRLLGRYPDARPLEALLAERLGLDPGEVIVTAGADEALDRVCRARLAPGMRAILHEPTFEMLPRYAALSGGEVTSVAWSSGPFPTDAIVAELTLATSLVVVVTPNNPTGAVATARDLERIAAAAPRATLLVDLAYTELADEDLTSAALALPNAIVTRTLSKAWGLAGLRVGYLAGRAAAAHGLRAVGSPYGVSSPSLALAEAWIARGDDHVKGFIERIREERAALVDLLASLGATPFPSQANFVLARFADAAETQEALASLGIAVRAFPGRPALEGCLRITCPGGREDFDRLTGALRSVLGRRS